MFNRIKPLPKAILIILIVAGAAYGILNSGALDQKAKPNVAQGDAQTVVVPAAQQNNASSKFDTYERMQSTREIKIGVQGNAAPFFSAGTGFNPDFLKLLTRQPEFSGMSFRTVDEVDTYDEVPKSLLKNAGGQPLVDIALDGLTFQDGDIGGVTYTIPYVSGFGYSLITSRTSGITSVASVGSKRIGILQGDPDVAAYVKSTFPNAQLVELSDALINGQRTWIADAFKRGKVDALVYDYPFAVSELNGTALQFAVSKLPNSDISYKIAVRADDDNLQNKLNDAIRRVIETEEYRNLLRTYFSSNKISATTASSNERTYTVAVGDTLSLIAERQLGDRRKFTVLEERNNLPNANLIQVGQVLVIPTL